jgi:squalene synthase HpnC
MTLHAAALSNKSEIDGNNNILVAVIWDTHTGYWQNRDMHARTVTPAPITHYENFPVASWLCPAHLRAPITAIYHFARTADDIADEGTATAAQRLDELENYRKDLNAICTPIASETASNTLCHLSARWPQVFAPLHHAVRDYQLPAELLHNLLDAFVQDTQKSASAEGYTSHAELLDYCRRSANPVGRLLLHLYGVNDPLALVRSDAICSALQLINFWQDLSVDIPRGRYYLPQDQCQRFGVSQEDIIKQSQTECATQLIAHCVDLARASMQSGLELVHQIPGRAGWELRFVVQGGLRILDRIETLRYATLTIRPTLRWWDYPVILWRSLWM